jgi:hypothetical protein
LTRRLSHRRFIVLGLELVVVLGVAVLVCNFVGQRFRIAPPVLLLVSGVLLGFLPYVRDVQLPPEAVLFIFLPVLLYWESLTTSLREIRSNFLGIVLMSTALVFATAGVVAVLARAVGVAWGPAWVLGAAVAPTDATAVGMLARVLPHHDVTVLAAWTQRTSKVSHLLREPVPCQVEHRYARLPPEAVFSGRPLGNLGRLHHRRDSGFGCDICDRPSARSLRRRIGAISWRQAHSLRLGSLQVR